MLCWVTREEYMTKKTISRLLLQVVAYGVGGQYEAHHDYFGEGILAGRDQA